MSWIYLSTSFFCGMVAQCIITAMLQIHREKKQKQQEELQKLQELLTQILAKEKQNEKNL